MKTIAYVDGYNLYHGLLKYSPYKWLDVRKLVAEILRVQDPASVLTGTKFFTSNIKGAYARRGEASVQAQQAYHRALKASGVVIREGRFDIEEVPMPRVIPGRPCDRRKMVRVWRLMEKFVDVKMALEIYRDAAQNACDQIIVVTSDTDLAPALELVRSDFPAMRIGLVLPRGDKAHRKSGTLEALADWSRSHIKDTELRSSQFPDRVPTAKKPADKPPHWYAAEGLPAKNAFADWLRRVRQTLGI